MFHVEQFFQGGDFVIDKSYLGQLFDGYGLTLNDRAAEQFDIYAAELVSWNEKINLTAITAPDEICEKHFLDSVLPFFLIDRFASLDGAGLLDVGTGAGFPSLPLKILNSSLKLTLLDSLNKRINFLNTLLAACGLDGEAVHGRAEELGRKDEWRENFDIVTARAVAKLSTLCEYCLPFVRVGGCFVALKGANGNDELDDALNAIKTLGGRVEKAIPYHLPCGDGRMVIVIKKIAPTPKKYPRNKGQMDKKPL